jgi:hypothetical protein
MNYPTEYPLLVFVVSFIALWLSAWVGWRVLVRTASHHLSPFSGFPKNHRLSDIDDSSLNVSQDLRKRLNGDIQAVHRHQGKSPAP